MDDDLLRDSYEAIASYLGDAYPTLARFRDLLADQGVVRGLIGPREVPRLWDRHLLNSAAVAQYLPTSGRLVDVGTGAGLPGVVLAAMRPDLEVTLVEPMERRVRWLREVVDELELTSVDVVRGRAEELHGALHCAAVTARAVAPMERLARWALPLVEVGGVLLAVKGRTADEELREAATVISGLGGDSGEVLDARTVSAAAPTTVVRVRKERVAERPAPTQGKSSRKARPEGRRPVRG